MSKLVSRMRERLLARPGSKVPEIYQLMSDLALDTIDAFFTDPENEDIGDLEQESWRSYHYSVRDHISNAVTQALDEFTAKALAASVEDGDFEE